MIEIVFGKSACGTMKYMGTDPTDLYCFSFGLSTGDLAEKEYPDISELKARAEHGESLRLWFSRKSPEESCGFHWLMAQLQEIENAEIFAVPLPEYFELPNNQTMTCSSWGAVDSECWEPLLKQKTHLPVGQRVYAAMRWQELEQENAPLRAVINGNLVSVPADFYDHFLIKELEKQNGDFMEAQLIAKVMGYHQLGIGDELLHQRIETFIQNGIIEIISPAENGKPITRRILKKA